MDAVVHGEGTAEDAAVGAELLDPICVAEHQHGRSGERLIGGIDETAKHGLYAEHIEVISGDDSGDDAFWYLGAEQCERHGVIFGDIGESSRLLAIVLHLLHREADAIGAHASGGLLEVNDAARIAVGQWSKQDSVDHGKDGGVGSDAETQRKHGHDAKAGGTQ